MVVQQYISKNWQMRRVGEAAQLAVVPGSVYTDLLRRGEMEDPFWKDNEIRALSLMEKDYEYVTCFDAEKELLASSRILLRFDGLDTIADIYLNGTQVGAAYNMHRIWEYDVTHILKETGNELKVLLHSPLKFIRDAFAECRTLGSEDAMDGFVHIRKAHCMFGWDWGAHLPDAGIFREVTLLGITGARLDSVYIRQEHTDGEVSLQFQVEAEREQAVSAHGCAVEKISVKNSGGDENPGSPGFAYTVELTTPEGDPDIFRFSGRNSYYQSQSLVA